VRQCVGVELSLAREALCGNVPCVPRKIRQLVADLERVGFELVPGGKRSHRSTDIKRFPAR